MKASIIKPICLTAIALACIFTGEIELLFLIGLGYVIYKIATDG